MVHKPEAIKKPEAVLKPEAIKKPEVILKPEIEITPKPEKEESETSEEPEQEVADNDGQTEEEARAEALETIRNFVPKRPIVPSPMFPDLCLENEKKMRTRVGGSRYWHFPFRHSVYDSMTTPSKQIW